MNSLERPDLLGYLESYAASARRCGRLEAWRARELRRRDVAGLAAGVADRLRAAGIDRGDRVGIYVADGPLWIAALFGAMAGGAAAVPIDIAHGAELASRAARRLQLRAWVVDDELAELDTDLPAVGVDWRTPSADLSSVALPPPEPERPALVVLTSGTTGDPQAVELRHSQLRAVLDPLADEIHRYALAIRVAPRLRIAVALPASHLYGQLMGVYLPVLLDADVDFVGPMAAGELARRLKDRGTWVLATVPHVLDRLADHLRSVAGDRWGADDLERRLEAALGQRWPRRWMTFAPLRRQLGWRLVALVSGGARLDPDLEMFWRRLGYVVVQGYGLTEAAPLVTLGHPLRSTPGSVGRPLPGVEVRLAADGEILVRGANVAQASGGTTRVDADGWLHTGDLGKQEADGSIRFLGRRDDRIVTAAGVNVDPQDVVSELRRQPGIADALVLQPRGRGRLHAVLQAAPGVDVAGAVRAANRGLPDAARVRQWHVWPGDLPRTPTGKPRRPAIRAWLDERLRESAPRAAPAGDSHGVEDPDLRRLLELVADVSGEEAGALGAETRVGEALDSLARVDLAARLEEAYGLFLDDTALDPERSLAEVAADLGAWASTAGEVEVTAAGRAEEPGRRRPPTGRSRRREGAPAAPAPPPPARAPVGSPAARVPSSRWRRAPPVRLLRGVLRELQILPLFRAFVRVEPAGLEHLAEATPPFLLVANHASLLDPLAILCATPHGIRRRLAPAARWEHFEEHPRGDLHWFLGVLALDLVPLVQRGDWRPTLRVAGGLADRGSCPLIFPEGRRSPDGSPRSFLPGAALLARELHLPVVPCAHAGLHAVLPPGQRWPRRGRRRPRVVVRFGAPLPTPRADADLAELTSWMQARVASLHDRARHQAGTL